MANWITLSRLLPLALTVVFLYLEGVAFPWAAIPLILLLLVLDLVDGVVARRTGSVSRLGSALDVAMDRLVEFILWVCFSDLRLIPVWVPLVVIARGLIVDAIRALVLAQGETAFGMMHSRLGRFLVSSRFMRDFYGVTKTCAFLALAGVHALRRHMAWAGVTPALLGAMFWIYPAGYALTVLAVALCLARGIPVLLDARAVLRRGLPDDR
jgi:CDP-diacylglycerol--glycerol-3-phosphate 3-phosphatidyltransferase